MGVGSFGFRVYPLLSMPCTRTNIPPYIRDTHTHSHTGDLNAKKDDVQISVLRNATTLTVSTHDLVVGDVVMLSTGDILPADGVIIGRNDLAINEKMLTGEAAKSYNSKCPGKGCLGVCELGGGRGGGKETERRRWVRGMGEGVG